MDKKITNHYTIERCPFCAGEAELQKVDGMQMYYVICLDCEATGPNKMFPENAVTHWNCRPTNRPADGA